MNTIKLLSRIDDIIKLGESSIIEISGTFRVNSSIFTQFKTEGYTFIEILYGVEHRLYKEFVDVTRNDNYHPLLNSISILKAIRSNIEGGWLLSQRGLIAAEIFEDFFEMAEHLLDEGYKDAAAVMVGALLEQHLKEVCKNHSIDINKEHDKKLIYKKAELLNNDLYKANVYGSSDQKQVTAWLGLRNDAAHGNYNKYEHQQVKLMLYGVRNFITRIS